MEHLFTIHSIDFESYDSAESFLGAHQEQPFGCILTDLDMPGMTGIELFEFTRNQGWSMPTLIITAFGEVNTCAGAFKAGVVDYLQKPVVPTVLIEKVKECLEISTKYYENSLNRLDFAGRLKTLTSKELEVLALLVDGHSMKAIASEFGTSFQAVSRHRQRILEKMGSDGDVSLARWVFQHRTEFDRLLTAKG